MKKPALSLFSLIASLFFAIVFIKFCMIRAPEEVDPMGLGKGTVPYFPEKNGLPIQIERFDDLQKLMVNVKKNASGKELVLCLGNSQVFGINQYQPGQENSTEILFDTLIRDKKFVISYALANANLQEYYVVYRYLTSVLPVKQVLLPVFFDDTREAGLRNDLLRPELKKMLLSRDEASGLDSMLAGEMGKIDDNVPGRENEALENTFQKSVEESLNRKLSNVSSVWNERANLRTVLIYNYLFKLRNRVFNIDPTSKRRLIPARYKTNMSALWGIASNANRRNIDLLVYIPPIRADVEQPYIAEEYSLFKEELSSHQVKYGYRLINTENVVPAACWGMKASTTAGGDDMEIDFMHFQAEGHRLLANTLTSEILKPVK